MSSRVVKTSSKERESVRDPMFEDIDSSSAAAGVFRVTEDAANSSVLPGKLNRLERQSESPLVNPFAAPEDESNDSAPDKEQQSAQESADSQEVLRLEAENAALLSQIEDIKKAAELQAQKAHDAGLQEGLKKRENFESMLQERYLSSMQTMEMMTETLRDLARHEALELSVVLARRIIQEEVKTSPHLLIAMAKRALATTVGKKELTFKLNPEDFKRVKEAMGEDAPSFAGIAKVYFSEDENIEQGGCLLETDIEQVDLTLSRQLDQLKRAIDDGDQG